MVENRTIGIRDLASELSLSVASVSRALNNQPGVGKKTRERILQAATEKGYVPDARARSFRTRRSRQIGIILPSLGDPTFVEKIRDAHGTAWELGYDVIFVSTEWDPRREAAAWKHLLGHRVDGVITLSSIDLEHCRKAMEDQGLRVLLLSSVNATSARLHAAGSDVIQVDAGSGLQEAADHLLRLGHRRIGLLGFQEGKKNIIHHARSEVVRQQVVHAGLRPEDVLTFIETVSDTLEAGYMAMASWIKDRRPLPSAIQAINDYVALGAVRALADAGLSVPVDLSIVGYSNIDLAQYAVPRLTTVSHVHLRLGSQAVRTIVQGIESPNHPPVLQELKSCLIVRESTGTPGK